MRPALAHIRAMGAYALADPLLPGTVSLAQNESAFAASGHAVRAGRAVLDAMAQYPDPDWQELRAAIAAVHALDANSILCGAGSMELIACLIRAYAGPGDEVLGNQHGYLFAASATLQAGALYTRAPEIALTVAVDNMLQAVTERTRLAFVCNPGNPTGTRIANADILRLRDELPDSIMLIVDQAYGEFDEQDPTPVFDLVSRGDTVVLRTLSKAYALAGARVGWGVFPRRIADEVRKLVNPNNISTVGQAMATAAMQDQSHMRQLVTKTARLREDASRALRSFGYTIPKSHTNFLLIRFADAEEASRADHRLREAGLMLRPMLAYGLGDCLRATIAPRATMDRLLEVLARTAPNTCGSARE